MIITCNNCNSRFNIDEKLIKPQGSKVKCSKCQTIFTVYPPPAEEEPIVTPPPLPPEPELELPPPPPPPPPPALKPAAPVAPPSMPPLLDEDEDSGVDIEKDFAPKSSRSTRKPVFEEPDVVGGEAPEEQPVAPAAQPTRVPRRVPARSAGGATTGTQPRSDRPVRSAQRRPVPAQAASADAPARRTMMPPVAPSMPPPETDEFVHDEDAFTDTTPTPPAVAKPAKGKRGKPAKEKPVKEKPVKEKKERSSSGGGLKKLLLLILIIVILLIVAAFALPKAGIQVPFLDKLNLSQLLGGSGGKTEEPPPITLPNRNVPPEMGQNQNSAARVDAIQDSNGILHFYMDSDLVNSGFLGNTSSGIIIIVEGLLQNNYDEARKAIKIVGRLYNERYELEQEKIVYAGNLLTEDELVTLNPTEMENRLFTNGREATAPANGSIPFMIVFSNIPEPVSAYTYECELVSSERAAEVASEPTP